MPRITTGVALAVTAAVIGLALAVGASPDRARANPALDVRQCGSPDATLAADGYACYNLYNKGQLGKRKNPGFAQVPGAKMYLKLDNGTLDIVVTGVAAFTEAKLCLDDDTDPINDAVGNNTAHCVGNSAPNSGKRDQLNTFGLGVGALNCTPSTEGAGLYAFFVDKLGSQPYAGGFQVHVPNVDASCSEVVLHFNDGGLSIVGFGQIPEPPAEDAEGCTPGYWKQPQHAGSWTATGYAPGDSLQDVFGNHALDGTLLEALSFKGGPGVDGAKQILLRAAVAALLNAAHPDIDYGFAGDVIALVTAALGSDRETMLALATELDLANNARCPF